MKIEQLANNQIVVREQDCRTLTSYGVTVVQIKDGKTYLDKRYWNYSKTTSKYRARFLNESTKETQKRIDSGEYILTDLN